MINSWTPSEQELLAFGFCHSRSRRRFISDFNVSYYIVTNQFWDNGEKIFFSDSEEAKEFFLKRMNKLENSFQEFKSFLENPNSSK
jgi:hypothetical protein